MNRERIYSKLEENDCCSYLYTKSKEVIKRLKNRKEKKEMMKYNDESDSDSESESEDEDSIKIFDKYLKKIDVSKMKQSESNKLI